MKEEKKDYIYISCPVIVPKYKLDNIYNQIIIKTGNMFDIKFWNRKEHYNVELLNKAKAVVIVPSYNEFEFYSHSLPSGVMREFNSAIANNQRVFLVYRNVKDEYNTYEIEYDSKTQRIKGIVGTTSSLFEYMNSVSLPNELSLYRSNHHNNSFVFEMIDNPSDYPDNPLLSDIIKYYKADIDPYKATIDLLKKKIETKTTDKRLLLLI